MEVKQLIEAVRQRPILYESTKKSYKDANKKKIAWASIATELDVKDKELNNCVGLLLSKL